MTNNDKKEYWSNEYWDKLQNAKDDSEAKLEKYLFTISTGAVGLLLGTLNFIKPQDIKILLWSFGAFVLAMLICIVYHFISICGHNKQFRLIEEFKDHQGKGDNKIRRDINVRNFVLILLHVMSLICIIVGIIIFIIHLSNNIQ